MISSIALEVHTIVIQESWILESKKTIYSIEGYQAFHCCRPDGYGGLSFFVYIKILNVDQLVLLHMTQSTQ